MWVLSTPFLHVLQLLHLDLHCKNCIALANLEKKHEQKLDGKIKPSFI